MYEVKLNICHLLQTCFDLNICCMMNLLAVATPIIICVCKCWQSNVSFMQLLVWFYHHGSIKKNNILHVIKMWHAHKIATISSMFYQISFIRYTCFYFLSIKKNKIKFLCRCFVLIEIRYIFIFRFAQNTFYFGIEENK